MSPALRARDRRRIKVFVRLEGDDTASAELRALARQAIVLVLEPYPVASREALFEGALVRRSRRRSRVGASTVPSVHSVTLAGDSEGG